jgi:hypothetical protein
MNEENSQSTDDQNPAEPPLTQTQIIANRKLAWISIAAGLLAIVLNFWPVIALPRLGVVELLIIASGLTWMVGLLSAIGLVQEFVCLLTPGRMNKIAWRKICLSLLGLLLCALAIYAAHSYRTCSPEVTALPKALLALGIFLQGGLFGALGMTLGLVHLKRPSGPSSRARWAFAFSVFGLCVIAALALFLFVSYLLTAPGFFAVPYHYFAVPHQ